MQLAGVEFNGGKLSSFLDLTVDTQIHRYMTTNAANKWHIARSNVNLTNQAHNIIVPVLPLRMCKRKL